MATGKFYHATPKDGKTETCFTLRQAVYRVNNNDGDTIKLPDGNVLEHINGVWSVQQSEVIE